MRQIYTALAILLPILMLMGVSILSITALQTHPHDGDPLPPRPGSQPAGGGDEGPPTPKINPLDDPLPPRPG